MHTLSIKAKNADVLIILGYSCCNDQVSKLLKERLDVGFELFQKFKFKKIIVTGNAVIASSTKTEAECMYDYLMMLGVKNEDIILEKKAMDTIANIRECQKLMDRNGLKSALVVSNSFHLRRTKWITQKLNFQCDFFARRTFLTLINQIPNTLKEIYLYLKRLTQYP